jgi:perosamine synthetase
MLGKIKQKLKEPLTQCAYQFLMREAQYHWGRKPFGPEELKLVTEALISQNLFGVDGKMVNGFEKEFAQTYNVPYAVASTSGTAAIHTALGALDLNPGDEVITAPITDLGTVIPILYQNAVPVFADIDRTYNMDPADVEAKITPRTKAIIVVHLFGNPCNMDAMAAIARKHKIPLIEDCSQSHLTEYKGRYVGTIGDIACFSFQQSKHMTTGDGGMTITSNKAYYDKMKLFVDKGFMRKGWGARAYGFHAPNYRMNELTGAVGLAQLKKVKAVVARRNVMGTLLTQLLNDLPGITPAPVTDGGRHSYWLYPIYLNSTADMETFAKTMTAAGFWCGAGYTGKPIYLCTESLTAKKTYGTSGFPFNSAYVSKNYEYVEGLCPKAEETLKHLVTMPWDESWTDEKIRKAAATIKETLQKLSPSENVVKAVPKPQTAVPQTAAAEPTGKKIRIGIIGCGQMGEWHWNGYRKNANVECVAFADTEPSRAERFVAKTPGRVYQDYREMIRSEKLDGVSICTVPSTHHQMTLDLLDAGIHVLCEKPLALSAAQAQSMVQKAQEKKLVLLSAFKFRYFDEVREAKKILEQNTLGKILSFRLMFGGYISMAGTWFADKNISGGGVIMDNAPHAFDLVRHLLGEIADVQAWGGYSQGLPVEDNAQIHCRLEKGGSGVIDVSWTIPAPSNTYLEIYGQEGTLLLDFDGLNYKFKTWDQYKRVPNQTLIKDAFNRQLVHFADCIAGKAPSVTIAQDGLKAQVLIEKTYQTLKKTEL